MNCKTNTCESCTITRCAEFSKPLNEEDTKIVIALLKAVIKVYEGKKRTFKYTFNYTLEYNDITSKATLKVLSLPEKYVSAGGIYTTTKGWNIRSVSCTEINYSSWRVYLTPPPAMRSDTSCILTVGEFEDVAEALKEFKLWVENQ